MIEKRWEGGEWPIPVLKFNPSTLTQESKYHTQDFVERVSVLQHEWIQSNKKLLPRAQILTMPPMVGALKSLWLDKILLTIKKMSSPDQLVVMKILNFLSERNVAIPSSRRKLTIA